MSVLALLIGLDLFGVGERSDQGGNRLAEARGGSPRPRFRSPRPRREAAPPPAPPRRSHGLRAARRPRPDDRCRASRRCRCGSGRRGPGVAERQRVTEQLERSAAASIRRGRRHRPASVAGRGGRFSRRHSARRRERRARTRPARRPARSHPSAPPSSRPSAPSPRWPRASRKSSVCSGSWWKRTVRLAPVRRAKESAWEREEWPQPRWSGYSCVGVLAVVDQQRGAPRPGRIRRSSPPLAGRGRRRARARGRGCRRASSRRHRSGSRGSGRGGRPRRRGSGPSRSPTRSPGSARKETSQGSSRTSTGESGAEM